MSMLVAGLPLPRALVEVVESGRWTTPPEVGLLETVFRDRPTHPRFYSLQGIINETEHWRTEIDPEILEWYLGSPSDAAPPGDISQQESVLIGDLGPDRPFALDYRRNRESPSVVYLTTYNGWLEVAPNVETFLSMLGLAGVES